MTYSVAARSNAEPTGFVAVAPVHPNDGEPRPQWIIIRFPAALNTGRIFL
jgi:hypothetical protein